MKYMYLTTYISGKKYILEKLSKLYSGLHYTYINVIKSHMVLKEDPQTLTPWHDRLGHPGSKMMRRIGQVHIMSTHYNWHLVKNQIFLI